MVLDSRFYQGMKPPHIFPLSYDRTAMRSTSDKSAGHVRVRSPVKKIFTSGKRASLKKTSRSTKLTLSSKIQKNIGEFFSGRFNSTTPTTNNKTAPSTKLRKCLFNGDSSVKNRTQSKNTSALDETSSSSFTYSSNSQRYIDIDISGQSSKLDLHANLEILDLADVQPTPTKLENENESEKENSPKIHKTHSTTAKLNNIDIDKDEHIINPKALTKLHNAVVKEVDCCVESLRDNFVRPDGFYRFVEGDADERKEKVEYDLDDEDMCWLNLVRNSKINGIKNLNEDNFEMCLDRLEKIAAHLQLNSLKVNSGQHKSKQNNHLDDDDIFCSICLDDECQNSNVILLCDSCNLAVHQECYGVPLIPEGQWLCSWCQWKESNKPSPEESSSKKSKPNGKCKNNKNRTVKFVAGGDDEDEEDENSDANDGTCCLCPVTGGALKRTDNGKWAHVLCALWIPEVGFGSVEYLEPITKLGEVPAARHKLTCSVCKKKDAGACIQCTRKNCYTAFHIMCAQKIGMYMRIEQGVGDNDDDADSPMNIKKSFLCDVHKPEGARPFLPMYENGDDDDDDNKSSGGNDADDNGSNNGMTSTPRKSKRQSAKLLSKSKSHCQMNGKKSTNIFGSTANKSKLNSKSGINKSKSTTALVASTVVLELPTVSPNKLKEIAKECLLPSSLTTSSSSSSSSLTSSLSSLQDVMAAVHSYWLLKRKSRNNIPLLKTYYTHLMSNHMPSKMGSTDDTKSAYDGLKDAKKLRNEMEKVRLLMELVRKREKLKLLMVKLKEQIINTKLNPWNAYLCRILDRLQSLDKCDVFAHPVAVDQVPGYKQKIKEPMDFSTMRTKALSYKYETFEAFERDFNLMVSNCLLFNSKHTVYHKAAVKMKKQSQHILEEEKIRLQCFPKDALPLLPSNEELEVISQKSFNEHSNDEISGEIKTTGSEINDKMKKEDGDKTCNDNAVDDGDKVVHDIIGDVINIDDDGDGDDDSLQSTCKRIRSGICRLSDWVKRQTRIVKKADDDKNGDNNINDDNKNHDNDNNSNDDNDSNDKSDNIKSDDCIDNCADDINMNGNSSSANGCYYNDGDNDININNNSTTNNNKDDISNNNDNVGDKDDVLNGGTISHATDKSCDDDDDNITFDNDKTIETGNNDNNNNKDKSDNNDKSDGADDLGDEDVGGLIIEMIELEDGKKSDDVSKPVESCDAVDDDNNATGNSDQFFSDEILADNDDDGGNNDARDNGDKPTNSDNNKDDHVGSNNCSVIKRMDGDADHDNDKNDDGNDDDDDVLVETISIEDEEEICVIDKSDDDDDDDGKVDTVGDSGNCDDDSGDSNEGKDKKVMLSDNINDDNMSEQCNAAAADACAADIADGSTCNINVIGTDKAASCDAVVDHADVNEGDDDDIDDEMMLFQSKIVESNSNILVSSTNCVNMGKESLINFLTSLLTSVKNSSEVDIRNNLKLEVKNENLTIDGNKIENVVGLNLSVSPMFKSFNKLMMLCSKNNVNDENDDDDDDCGYDNDVEDKAGKCQNVKNSAKRQHLSVCQTSGSSSSLSAAAAVAVVQKRKKFQTSKSFDIERTKKTTHKAISSSPSFTTKSENPLTRCEKLGAEIRRTSDRMKTATHRYLIDDNLFFQSLTSPLKKKRKQFSDTSTVGTAAKSTPTRAANSSNDNDGLMNSDEPPVLSRCPSPFAVSYVNDDDEEQVEEDAGAVHNHIVSSDKFFNKRKKYSTNKKAATSRSNHQPIRKKLKYFADPSPPRLVKNISEPSCQSSVRKLLKSKLLKNNTTNKMRRKNKNDKNKTDKSLKYKMDAKYYKKKIDKRSVNSSNNKNQFAVNNVSKKKINCIDDYGRNVSKACSSMPELIKNISSPPSSASSSSSSLSMTMTISSSPKLPPLLSSLLSSSSSSSSSLLSDLPKPTCNYIEKTSSPTLSTNADMHHFNDVATIADNGEDNGDDIFNDNGDSSIIKLKDNDDGDVNGGDNTDSLNINKARNMVDIHDDPKQDNKVMQGDKKDIITADFINGSLKTTDDNDDNGGGGNGYPSLFSGNDNCHHHKGGHDNDNLISRDVDDYDDDDIMIDCEEVEISTEDDEDDDAGDDNDDMRCDNADDDCVGGTDCKVITIITAIDNYKNVNSKRNIEDGGDVDNESAGDNGGDDGCSDNLHVKKKIKLDGVVNDTNDVGCTQISSSSSLPSSQLPSSLSSSLTSSSLPPLPSSSSLLPSSSSSLLSSSLTSTFLPSSLSSLCNSRLCNKNLFLSSASSSSSSSSLSSSLSVPNCVITSSSHNVSLLTSTTSLSSSLFSSSLATTSSSLSLSVTLSSISSLLSSLVPFSSMVSPSSLSILPSTSSLSIPLPASSSSTSSLTSSSSSLTTTSPPSLLLAVESRLSLPLSSSSSSSSSFSSSLKSAASFVSANLSSPSLTSTATIHVSSSSSDSSANLISPPSSSSASSSSSSTSTSLSLTSSTSSTSSSSSSSSSSTSSSSTLLISPSKTICLLNMKMQNSPIKPMILTSKTPTSPLSSPTSSSLASTFTHFTSSSALTSPTFIQLNSTILQPTTPTTTASKSMSLSSPPVEFFLKSAQVVIEKLDRCKPPLLTSLPSLSIPLTSSLSSSVLSTSLSSSSSSLTRTNNEIVDDS